jgi:hypothetical protein
MNNDIAQKEGQVVSPDNQSTSNNQAPKKNIK